MKCPKCAQPVQLSAAEAEIDFAVPPDPGPAPSALPSSPRAGEPRAALPRARTLPPPPPAPLNDGWRTYGRWGLAAALLPLVFSVFMANDNPIERLAHMVDRDPALAKAIETVENKGGELDDLLRVLPDHRIEGSLHSRDTKAHWLYAALSAGAFWGLILLLYPLGRASSKEIWAAGLFVGTVGILLLLGLQYVASWTQGTWIRGRSIIVIIFYIVKFIGFSYRAALDPTNNFFLSMLGFTFGVGLCEELCKALPLLWHFKKTSGRRADTLDVRGAVVWGLAAGIGFGVSEGITYSGDSYNG
ncbi:MAG: PrsW family intramembrane metalloprotease, partial [Planctomycetes bacterium]|nr:PrsW family intramembrane metalloprotease [Planctomycetota bacterium]